MKTPIVFLLALAALGPVSFAQAPVGVGSVKILKVLPAIVKTPEYTITGGQNKRYKLGEWLEIEVEYETKPEDIDDLTFKFTVMFEKKLLDGEVTYSNIAKGKDHFAVMYLSPKGMEKLLPGGKALNGAAIENVWVEVSKSGLKLDTASHKPGAIPNAPHVTGLILNKDETPFAPLYYDRYESIKKSR